ncbi:MAG: carbamoyl phosphate synthase small subunit [Bilifractor sp.]|nr:carbamoyl phosphate synthase small subunit [Lachnospiraceae bacterium]MDY2837312.1 carbamoyl phosphate synthase small subunit [Bilifractor sp.]
MKAYLILEDGHVFTGKSIGSRKTVISEIVFNTSMTGYEEVLTDPSYSGQAVCMTYPLIGNYGICYKDQESLRPYMDGFIVHELSRVPSNFREEDTIQAFLKRYDVPGIEGIDTRALTKILRESGTMNGMITTDPDVVPDKVLPEIRAYKTGNEVEEVTCTEKEFWPATDTVVGGITSPAYKDADPEAPVSGKRTGRTYKVALMDFGVKYNIIRSLNQRGCDVTVYPAWTKAEEVLAGHPDGIMLTNGPGDPQDCPGEIREVRKLYESDVPIYAICMGHQLMALAAGFNTKKMKYGHRGGNHPVKDLETGRVYITSQNHGYVVDTDTVDPEIAEPAYVNVNDRTNEGLRYKGKHIFTTQFHPEACPGPQDSAYLFDKFIRMMGGDQ